MIQGTISGKSSHLPHSAGRILLTMTPSHEQWAAKARYDFETAGAMLKSGRYVYVLFCCQQAVEKMIKAVMVKRSGVMPPRIHNLIRLSELAGITAADDEIELLGLLSSYYVQSRYPEEIEDISSEATRVFAEEALTKTEECLKWLSSMIP